MKCPPGLVVMRQYKHQCAKINILLEGTPVNIIVDIKAIAIVMVSITVNVKGPVIKKVGHAAVKENIQVCAIC